MKSIAAGAFAACSETEEIHIPASVESIAEGAFNRCARLRTVTAAEGGPMRVFDGSLIDTASGTLLIALNGAIPADAGVTRIGEYAFQPCKEIAGVYIPRGVTKIGAYAFAGCNKLRTVRFGGTEEEWSAVAVADGNPAILSAKIEYSAEE